MIELCARILCALALTVIGDTSAAPNSQGSGGAEQQGRLQIELTFPRGRDKAAHRCQYRAIVVRFRCLKQVSQDSLSCQHKFRKLLLRILE
jgi:hypothetical protein